MLLKAFTAYLELFPLRKGVLSDEEELVCTVERHRKDDQVSFDELR